MKNLQTIFSCLIIGLLFTATVYIYLHNYPTKNSYVMNLPILRDSNMLNVSASSDKPTTSKSTNRSAPVVTTKSQTKRKHILAPSWLSRTGAFSNKGFKDCEFSNCYFTYGADYKTAQKADLVIADFFSPLFKRKEFVSRQNPPMISFSLESPGRERWIKTINNASGIATYMKNSTVYIPYMHTIRLSKEEAKSMPQIDYSKEKTKGAFAYVSNCNSVYLYNRIETMRKLSKYIDVDIYGGCTGKKPCPTNDDSKRCFAKIHKNYRFYLSFENSLCRDYITEKFWRRLRWEYYTVPVAVGGTTLQEYTSVAPPNSFIHLYNFTSFDALGKYLKYLTTDDEAYNRYHQWRRTHKVGGMKNQACEFCKLAHNPELLKDHPPFADVWNNRSNHCIGLDERYKN